MPIRSNEDRCSSKSSSEVVGLEGDISEVASKMKYALEISHEMARTECLDIPLNAVMGENPSRKRVPTQRPHAQFLR